MRSRRDLRQENVTADTRAQTDRDSKNLTTPTDLGGDARSAMSSGLTRLPADVFTLFAKTKNFHWHVSGPHFRDYRLLLDDQATLVFAMIDPVAERSRRPGAVPPCAR